MILARIFFTVTLAAALGGETVAGRTKPAGAPATALPVPSALPSGQASSSPGAVIQGLTGLAASALGGAATGAPQQYSSFVKGAERQTGLIDILHKDDEVYLDLTDQQLNHQFIVAPVLASGVGDGAFAGRIYQPFVLEFQRVGKRMLWISKNTAFSAPAGTSAANALAISTTDSVIASSPIVAEDEPKQRFIVSANFFLSDYENVARDLGGRGADAPIILLGAARPGYSLDQSRSYFEKTKALPKNDEILANLVFSGPPSGPAGAPDGRGVRIRMHYSILDAPPDDSYVPRLADDRVGYFITAQKHFDNDAATTPFARYINRWNFNNGPIVYYLTNEIPPEYKPSIRAALLEWNKAFAAAGIPNAIEVRNQPDDPNWDPDDIRYSTVRWLTSDQPAFSAYGPHISDPRTGQILRVEIVIDGEAMRAVKRGFVEQVVPTRHAAADLPSGNAALAAALVPPPATDADAAECDDTGACDRFMRESAEFAAVGTLSLQAGGASEAALDAYADKWLYSVVLHEAGHNFGLRHNFAAAIYPLADLHNRAFTAAHGLVNSVMNYTPVNLSPPGQPQGDFFQMRLGPYDKWAIRYGYERFAGVKKPSDESDRLRQIADESTRPDYSYATDEDATGPRAIDPGTATFLLSTDRFAFYRNQFDVADDLVARLDKVYPRDDRPYADERQAFLSTMRQYGRAAMLATRYIGGVEMSRSHRGQPGGVAPFRAVSRAQERRAFVALSENVFSSHALRFSPGLLNDLGANNYAHRGATGLDERPDFAVSAYVASLQDAVMYQLFSPQTMSRIADEELKVKGSSEVMSLGDLFGWTQSAVWDDLHPGMRTIYPLHRGLQRRYTNYLIALALAPSYVVEVLGFPGDASPLARFELRRLEGRLTESLRSPNLDVATRAHLEDVENRVRHALEPEASRGA